MLSSAIANLAARTLLAGTLVASGAVGANAIASQAGSGCTAEPAAAAPIVGPAAADPAPAAPFAVQPADPARVVPAAGEAAAVREALRRLEEPYRETVALRYFAGLTVPEIAEACNRPQGTVKTHLHRGLLRLRERLDTLEAAR